MLALKLMLVPVFLLLVTLAGKRWGPSVAGWLAGLPIVAGPILFFLVVEHGTAFVSHAAAASLSAIFASVAFSLAYSHSAQRTWWAPALALAILAWAVAALLLSLLPSSAALSLVVALLTLLIAPRLFPALKTQPGTHLVSHVELCCRMTAGAALTIAVTVMSGIVGSNWSGLLAVFPVLGIVLAVFSHRTHGAVFVATLLRSMATGLYSFATFCFVLSLALLHTNVTVAFLMAAVLAVAVQVASKRHLSSPASEPSVPDVNGIR